MFYVEYALTLSSTHSKYQQVFATTTIFGRKMCVRWNVVFAKRYVHVWISVSGRLSYVYFARIKFEICGPISNIKKKRSLKSSCTLYQSRIYYMCTWVIAQTMIRPNCDITWAQQQITNVCCRVQVSLPFHASLIRLSHMTRYTKSNIKL